MVFFSFDLEKQLCVFMHVRVRGRDRENEGFQLGYGHQMKMINFIPIIHSRHINTWQANILIN